MAIDLRRGRWLPLVYYYLATLVGLSVLLIGLIVSLMGLVQAAVPQASDDVRYALEDARFNDEGKRVEVPPAELERIRADAIQSARTGGFFQALQGFVSALVGAPVFFWHLRQARRHERTWAEPGASPPASATV